LGHHPASFIYSSELQFVPAHSVAVAYRREVFDRLGLFDERFDACEDVEFNHRVDRSGMRCLLVPDLRVSYHPRASLRGLWRQMDRYGRGRTRLLRKHQETFSPLGFAPAMLLLLLAASGTGAWWLPELAMAGGLLAAGYFVSLAGFAAYLACRKGSVALLPRLPLVFLTLHMGAGLGMVREAIFGKRIEPALASGSSAPRSYLANDGLGAGS
jgi:succinoglycan biosynthesis protein ExoA